MLDYELVFLDRPEKLGGMRVTVWYLDEDGQRTGAYTHVIEYGHICIQSMDQTLQLIDDPELPFTFYNNSKYAPPFPWS